MAGLRPSHCYREIQRAYTRKSKFKRLGYIKAIPSPKIVRYDMGDPMKSFSHKAILVSKVPVQIRHNSIESARTATNRILLEKLGSNYTFKILIYPHHVLRENKMLTGAGADRMQTGMQLAFGRPVGIAAQVRKNQPVFAVSVNEEHLDVAKAALKKATPRLPGKFRIEVLKLQEAKITA